MSEVENRMVIDRAWPAQQAATPEMIAESLATDAMYSEWDWMDDLDNDALREIVMEAAHACWRGDYKSEADRLNAVRESMKSVIEAWAEREASDE